MKETLPVVNQLTLPEVKKLSPIDLNELPLNNKEKIFVVVYCSNGFKKNYAYLAAGYKARSKQTLERHALKMLYRDNVQLGIRKIVDKMIAPFINKINYELWETLYYRAFYKIGDFYKNENEMVSIIDLPKHLQKVVDGITTKFNKNIPYYEYVLPDRNQALRDLRDMLEKVSVNEGESFDSLKKIRDEIFNRTETDNKILSIDR